MQKHRPRDQRTPATQPVDRHQDLPTWRRTTPRANPEVHRADFERSTERLEMLLGH